MIFDEGTDIYWARSRVLEYIQAARNKLPADVNPVLGPDATEPRLGVPVRGRGWNGQLDIAQLRSLQDWNLKLALESVPGVSQVASVGGFVKQYQITVDPESSSRLQHPDHEGDGGGPEKQSRRGRKGDRVFRRRVYGPRTGVHQETSRTSRTSRSARTAAGTPIYLKDVANVQLGPEIRRGVAELDGKGEVAGGIVIVRFGENVLNVIDRVKEKIRTDIAPSLPKGVKIVTTYDRSDLIRPLHR